MKLLKVISSSVDSIGYKNGILEVQFKNGECYIYSRVPKKIYNQLMKADSIGTFLNKLIKPNYTYIYLPWFGTIPSGVSFH